MEMAFKRILKRDFSCNIFKLLARDWALLTAGNPEKFNSMTIAWGGIGYVWYKTVTTVYVRPSRYTYEFMEAGDYYSLCFFGEDRREAL
jgi:flavin reductase (DIM6/NTAB) family NADH-FMN oxidoreductase RutF